MSNPEHVVVELPLSIDAVCAIGAGLNKVWPDAQILTEHDLGPNKMVIELSGPKNRSSLTEDDD